MGEILRKKTIYEVHNVHNTSPERGHAPHVQQSALEQCLLTFAESINELDLRLEVIEGTHTERLNSLGEKYQGLGSAVRVHAEFKQKVERMLDGIEKALKEE